MIRQSLVRLHLALCFLGKSIYYNALPPLPPSIPLSLSPSHTAILVVYALLTYFLQSLFRIHSVVNLKSALLSRAAPRWRWSEEMRPLSKLDRTALSLTWTLDPRSSSVKAYATSPPTTSVFFVNTSLDGLRLRTLFLYENVV